MFLRREPLTSGSVLSSQFSEKQKTRNDSFHRTVVPRRLFCPSPSLMALNKPKPLWKADDQQARLAELTAQSDEPAKDNPLRRDVRSLGAILGQRLVEQSGQELFESVEELRRLLIEHRETARRHPERASSPALMQKAQAIVSAMDLSRVYQAT